MTSTCPTPFDERSPPDGGSRPRGRDVLALASLLAFGVVAWLHAVHFYTAGHRGAALGFNAAGHRGAVVGHLVQALHDGLLALPVALVAALVGLRLATRVGLTAESGPRSIGRAALVSVVFSALLAPSVFARDLIDAALCAGWAGLGGLAPVARVMARDGVAQAFLGLVAALPLTVTAMTLAERTRRASAHPLAHRRLGLRLSAAAAAALLALGLIQAGGSADSSNRVEFHITDSPGRWFDTGVDIAGTRSLAISAPGGEVKFSGQSSTVHTVTSLIFPTGAAGMPFDTEAMKVSASTVLRTPGLYVFTCKIHPYMFGAVIVDDPATPELDLGASMSLLTGVSVPTGADLALRLVRTFFVATSPANWQAHRADGSTTWDPVYPAVSVLAFDAGGARVSVQDLDAFFQSYFGEPVTLAAATPPATPGVGEVWVDTQFEMTSRKEKPGTATAVNATTWSVSRKVALPQIDMNNPHNMWTDRDQTLIYQTQWFDHRLAVFHRDTGRLVRNISVGESPAHVMTRVDTDQVHVTVNGADREESVVELAPLATGIERRIDIGRPHPHAHWMGHDGKTMVTPNAFTADSTVFDFARDGIRAIVPVGAHPIATGMMPDSSKYYVANLLDSTLTVVRTGSGVVLGTINLLANYDPITGAITGPVGGMPIQTPVAPTGTYMVTANTLTATITIVDTDTDTVVAMLPCDPGCHGVPFGARQGGGYYAYVSSKFSNAMLVVDADPNNDGDPSDARIAGRVVLTAGARTAADDTVVGNAGMGGQGVLAIPVVYNGWVQRLPASWKALLTPDQRDPAP